MYWRERGKRRATATYAKKGEARAARMEASRTYLTTMASFAVLSEVAQGNITGDGPVNPSDKQRRTFLFELLCFAGNFDRAEKQLDILSQESPDALTGTLLYRAALAAERTRHELFEKKEYPRTESAGEPGGVCNGPLTRRTGRPAEEGGGPCGSNSSGGVSFACGSETRGLSCARAASSGAVGLKTRTRGPSGSVWPLN